MWGSRDSPNLPSGKRASFECGRGSGSYSGELFGTPTETSEGKLRRKLRDTHGNVTGEDIRDTHGNARSGSYSGRGNFGTPTEMLGAPKDEGKIFGTPMETPTEMFGTPMETNIRDTHGNDREIPRISQGAARHAAGVFARYPRYQSRTFERNLHGCTR